MQFLHKFCGCLLIKVYRVILIEYMAPLIVNKEKEGEGDDDERDDDDDHHHHPTVHDASVWPHLVVTSKKAV